MNGNSRTVVPQLSPIWACTLQAFSLLKKAEGNNKLSKNEVKELEEELRYDINTKFGTRNEDVAVKVYERRTGTEVKQTHQILASCNI